MPVTTHFWQPLSPRGDWTPPYFCPRDEILGRLSLLFPQGNLPRIKDDGSWEVRDEKPGSAPEFG